MGYRITTDSTCDLPPEFYRERDIKYIGLGFLLDGKEYKEDENLALTSEMFYNELRAGKQASTMQVNTYEFIQFMEPFLAAGDDVLHIAFSSGLSGTYSSCEQGAKELRKKYPGRKLVIIDSLAASMGEGLFVYYADENRKAGMSIEENERWLNENKLHLAHWFTVDDLMFLHRGGRVSKVSAIFGSMLGIKPVLHVDDEGHLILVDKARGRLGSLKALAAKMKESVIGDPAEQMVFISHGDCRKDVDLLKEKLEKELGVKKIMTYHIGTVIGSHSGPGTVALFFLGKQR